jgi:predicted xylose isomerase-like sugar epimerase
VDHIPSGSHRVVVVPLNVVAKIEQRHAADIAAFKRLRELLDSWEFAGLSLSAANRLEVYGRIDSIWYAVMVRLATAETPYNVLVTFHRVYERKVMARYCRGRIASRGDHGG